MVETKRKEINKKMIVLSWPEEIFVILPMRKTIT
jgi:hypothetical protein